MLLKEQTQEAINIFIQLLEKEPANFSALGQLIKLLRQAGRLEEGKNYIEQAEKNAAKSTDAGLGYIRGLFFKYCGEPQKALKDLNTARFDQFYGKDALEAMIEIYLNPHNELIFSSASNDASYSSSKENIKAAETLLTELQSRETDTTIVECNILIHTKNKDNVETA